jgi:Na+/melibiose symporter-like transporter
LVAFQGVGIAIMLNTATSLISDVIGSDAENSAFVYGCYSLFDKFANGILLFYLVEGYTNDESALRYIMSIIPLACAIGSYFFTFIGQKFYSHKMAKITGLKK